MALYTVGAALACPAVGRVLVVTDDPVAAPALTDLGALCVPDTPDAGLNPALAHGATEAAGRQPAWGVAVLGSDLPALRRGHRDGPPRGGRPHPRTTLGGAGPRGDATMLIPHRARIRVMNLKCTQLR